MNADPLSIALIEIAETKQLLECLISSSESFNYIEAKSALTKLNRKIRDLGKLQNKYQRLLRSRSGNICVIDFKASTAVAAHSSPQ